MVKNAAQVPGDVAPTPPTPVAFRLTGQQELLRRILAEQEVTAEALYVGACVVLADANNPDRLALAAHGIRELINSLPSYFDVPVLVRARLGDKVDSLHTAWNRARRNLQPDQPLPPRLWAKLEEFFAWRESERPTHRQRTADMLLNLDPAGRPLPAPIAELRAQEWLACQDFFVGSAHHGGCTEAELRQWLDFFERFVLDLVRPRTFENADVLDVLIAEGEGRG